MEPSPKWQMVPLSCSRDPMFREMQMAGPPFLSCLASCMETKKSGERGDVTVSSEVSERVPHSKRRKSATLWQAEAAIPA